MGNSLSARPHRREIDYVARGDTADLTETAREEEEEEGDKRASKLRTTQRKEARKFPKRR